jgi:hypothetical protein
MGNSGTGTLIAYSLTNGLKTLMMAPCTPGALRGINWTHVNMTSIPALGSFCIQEVGEPTTTQTLTSYLTTNPNFCATTCTLKLSALRILKKASDEVIPYIEYRVRGAGGLSGGAISSCFLQYGTPGQTDAICGTGFRLSNAIPLQSSTITSTAQVRGFKKVDTRSLEQTTTAEGLDFTIFQ